MVSARSRYPAIARPFIVALSDKHRIQDLFFSYAMLRTP
jgi:hypothetical protein